MNDVVFNNITMNLPGCELEKLVKAIISAYPTKNDLEMMVSYKLEENLEAIATGDNLNLLVFNLVKKWAIPQGKILDLIIAAYEHNSENRELKVFYESVAIKKELCDKYNFHTLISILQTIEDKNQIITIYNEQYCSKTRNRFQPIKSFDATKIILNLFQLMNTFDNIALNDFGDFFLKHLLHIKNIKNDLTKWIKENCPEVQIYTEIQNTNNIVNYIFVIVTPHPTVNKKYHITSEVAQFENNHTKINTHDYETSVTLSDEGYLEKEIISVAINEIINQLRSNPNIFNPPPIIELFLPNKLLIKDFGMKKINEAGIDQPIGHLYPFTVRSYNRFTDQASKGRLESKFQNLKKIIADTNDINNLQEYCHLITKNDLKLKPDKFYIHYISPGTPLCLWTKCSLEEDNRTIDDVYQEIFKISNNNFCKVYKIYEQLLSIRQKYYREYQERLIVGVLFDHDKLPTQISQLTSPNMSMNTA